MRADQKRRDYLAGAIISCFFIIAMAIARIIVRIPAIIRQMLVM